MALLPARRSGTVARPGSQAAGRWDPFGVFEDLYQRMGQLKAETDMPRRIEVTGG